MPFWHDFYEDYSFKITLKCQSCMVLIHIQSESMLRLYSGQHGFRGKIEIMKKKRLTVNDWVLTSLSYMMIFLGRLVPGAGRIVAGVWPLPCVGPQVRLQRLLPRKHPAIKKTFYLLNICFKWPIHNSHATVRNAHLGITPIQYTMPVYNICTYICSVSCFPS